MVPVVEHDMAASMAAGAQRGIGFYAVTTTTEHKQWCGPCNSTGRRY